MTLGAVCRQRFLDLPAAVRANTNISRALRTVQQVPTRKQGVLAVTSFALDAQPRLGFGLIASSCGGPGLAHAQGAHFPVRIEERRADYMLAVLADAEFACALDEQEPLAAAAAHWAAV